MTAHKHAPDHSTERLSYFSDAVFAIAITLLVIEIHVPHVDSISTQDHLIALIGLIPSFFGYLLSFLVIARFWMGHHTAFSLVERFDQQLIWPNNFLLMSIAFMPFATAYFAANTAAWVAILFYNLVLLMTAICSRWVIGLATDASRIRPDVDPITPQMLRARGTAVILGALTTVVATIIWRIVAESWRAPGLMPIVETMLMTIPLWLRWLNRRAAAPHSATR